MDNFTFELLLTVAGASAFVLLLLQVLWKTVGDAIDKDRFGPIISIATGVVVVVIASLATGNDPAQGVLTGITAGFAAMGMHDLGDSVGLPVQMELILGIALVFTSGVGFGWLLTWGYVSSLGWEQDQ